MYIRGNNSCKLSGVEKLIYRINDREDFLKEAKTAIDLFEGKVKGVTKTIERSKHGISMVCDKTGKFDGG